MEDKRIVQFKGEALTLVGSEIKVGDTAPDFKVLNKALEEVTLKDLKGKVKLVASVPSLDTPVCDLEIKQFNKEASKISEDVSISFISMDLPFAQNRFCEEFGVNNVELFSDHRAASFGESFGVLIKELRLLARSIFIVDASEVVKYAEIVPEVTDQPEYTSVLEALKEVAG